MNTESPPFSTEDEARNMSAQLHEKKRISEKELRKVAAKAFQFCQMATGITFRPYQADPAKRLVWSILSEDAEELTMIFSRQSGKCLARDTPVLMSDATIKPSQDIEEGDLLMGAESYPRRVLSLSRGREKMVRVIAKDQGFSDYEVNRSHILTLYSIKEKKLVDIPVEEFLRVPYVRSTKWYRGVRRPISLPHRPIPHDAYEIGLGIVYGFTTEAIRDYLVSAGVRAQPHIPDIYLRNNTSVRLGVLAGILDYAKSWHLKGLVEKHVIEVHLESTRLVEDIVWLCASLGLRASPQEAFAGERSFWTVTISGAIWRIPTKLRSLPRIKFELVEEPSHYKFSLEELPEDDYFGFVLDGDKRFLLGDLTVTHNTEIIATIVAGLMVLLPALAKFVQDERIQKFKDGFWVGIFAPSYLQANIVARRLKRRLYNPTMREVMADPDIDLPDNGYERLDLPNGSFVAINSTHVNVDNEGQTLHLIHAEEAQDIKDEVMERTIHPMAAETAGTIVKTGTARRYKCNFYEAIQRNARQDLLRGLFGEHRTNFSVDYKEVAKHSPRYAKYVQRELARLGYDSDTFRLAYRLHWLLERGQFISPELIHEAGVRRLSHINTKIQRGGQLVELVFPRPSTLVSGDQEMLHVAGLDIGRTNDSTLCTVGRIFYDYPIDVGDRRFYYIHIVNWLELHGDDHEIQYPQFSAFLKRYKLSAISVDSTGRGDPIADRLTHEKWVKDADILIARFVFSQQSKHEGYSLLLQELKAGRITYPAGSLATRTQKYRRFVAQFQDVEKNWKGKYMSVEAPAGGNDDYTDSAMLMLMASQASGQQREAEDSYDNPLFPTRRHRRVRRSRRSW